MPQRKSLLGAVLLVCALAASPAPAEDTKIGDITIAAPWARASAGMARAGAAFLTLVNHGDRPDRLVAAETSVARRPELHTHIHEGGVMKMRRVPAIELPAGETVELKPGGLHVMLMGLEAPLMEGESFALTLRFEQAGAATVTVPIKAVGAMQGGRMGHGKGHGQGKGQGMGQGQGMGHGQGKASGTQ